MIYMIWGNRCAANHMFSKVSKFQNIVFLSHRKTNINSNTNLMFFFIRPQVATKKIKKHITIYMSFAMWQKPKFSNLETLLNIWFAAHRFPQIVYFIRFHFFEKNENLAKRTISCTSIPSNSIFHKVSLFWENANLTKRTICCTSIPSNSIFHKV